jgi:hypothetical protein
VAGNHEYYRHALPGVTGELRAAAVGSAVRVLENDELVLGGVGFLGCTLSSGDQRRARSPRRPALSNARVCGRWW